MGRALYSLHDGQIIGLEKDTPMTPRMLRHVDEGDWAWIDYEPEKESSVAKKYFKVIDKKLSELATTDRPDYVLSTINEETL